MGNKHSAHKTFKKYNNKNKSKTLKNRKKMRGGGKWLQHKDGGWIYQLSNKNLKIGARSKKTTRQKEEGEVNSVVKPSFDWLDTSNLGKTRDEMTDFDIKEIADADNSNIGYITTSGVVPEEQQKQQMREVELDASKDNRLRWGSLNPRKKINKTVLGLKLKTTVDKGGWFEDTSLPGNVNKYYYVVKNWKRDNNDNISDAKMFIYGKEPGVGYTEYEKNNIEEKAFKGGGIMQSGGVKQKEMSEMKIDDYVIEKSSPQRKGKIIEIKEPRGRRKSYKFTVKFDDGSERDMTAASIKELKKASEEASVKTSGESPPTLTKITPSSSSETVPELLSAKIEEQSRLIDELQKRLKEGAASYQSNSLASSLIRVGTDNINYDNLFTQKEKNKFIKEELKKYPGRASALKGAYNMYWPHLTDDNGTLNATDKRPNPGWVPVAITDRQPFCMGTGSSSESTNEAASAQSEYSMDDAGGMWRGWAWRINNTYWAMNSGGRTEAGRAVPWLFTTKDMDNNADKDKLLTDPNLWSNFNEIRGAITNTVVEGQDINLSDNTFKLMDITEYITGEQKDNQEIVNLDFVEKHYYPNISKRQGWIFYYPPTEGEEAAEQSIFGIRGGLNKFRQALEEYSSIASEVRALMDTAILYPIFPPVEDEGVNEYNKRIKTAELSEEQKSWNDIVYFTAAPELRKIGITCDHVHDATDEGRAPSGMSSLFPRIKVKAHIDILQYLSEFFNKYENYSTNIQQENEVEQNLFKRCTHEMLQLTEEYMERPTTQIKDQTMKDVWNRILENTNSMSMYITCSIPKPKDVESKRGPIINQIRIIPSASIAHVLLKTDLNQNKNKFSVMMQDEQISTNNFSSYFAKVRHRIMGFISNEDPRVIFEKNKIRAILDKGNVALITVEVNENADSYPTDDINVKYSEQIFNRKSKEVHEGELKGELDGESKKAWNNIFKYIQSGSKGFAIRTEMLAEKKRVMLSDMLTGLLNDATVVEGLNEAGIFEGPISVGNRACVAIPPTPSLNDHAASMHCAGRKKRRQITVDSVIPDFKYDSRIFDDKRMNLAFANNITLQQMNPIYQETPDIKINMNRKLYKLNDSRVWSMLFGEEFSEYIESETCGVNKLRSQKACGACQCGAGTKFVGVKQTDVNCPNLKAKDIKEGKEKTIFKFNDAINNYFPKKKADYLRGLNKDIRDKYGNGGKYTLFKEKGKKLILKSSFISQSLCNCHLLRVFDNVDEYVEDMGIGDMVINTPDTLVGVMEDGEPKYEQTMPITANNLKAVVEVNMPDADKKRQPKACSQYCLCKGLCWGNILLASNAVSKINNIFKKTEETRCGIKERAKIKRNNIRHLIDEDKEEVYCLVNILLQKYHNKKNTEEYKRCEVALEYINEIAGDGLLPPMLLGRFLEIFLEMVRFDFNSGTDFYTFVKTNPTAEGEDVRKVRHKPQEAKLAEAREDLNIIWKDNEVQLEDVWDIFRFAFQKLLREKYAGQPDQVEKEELTKHFVWIPDFQLLLLGILTSLINLNNSTLATGGPTHGQGVNLTIDKEVVCYSDTAAKPMMKACMTQLGKRDTYTTFKTGTTNSKVKKYWAAKLAKWSGDAHQNMIGKICGYLLISSDEISFMTTRLIKSSRLCSVIDSLQGDPTTREEENVIFDKINFKTGEDALNCESCGDVTDKSMICAPELISANMEDTDKNFSGNNRFFNCFYSGESEKRGEQALFLHLLRLSPPEDVDSARRNTVNKLGIRASRKTYNNDIAKAILAKQKQKLELIKGNGKIDTKKPEYKGGKIKAAARATS